MILAASGKMGSGKDTVVEHLVRSYGFKRMAFADDLKYMCMSVFDLTHTQCFDEKAKFQPFEEETQFLFFWQRSVEKPLLLTIKHMRAIGHWVQKNGFYLSSEQVYKMSSLAYKNITFQTPRHLLQYVGTEICRDIVDIDYHAKVLKRKIDEASEANIAVADCRFENERGAIKAWKGTSILVNERETMMAADYRAKSHASENSFGTSADYDFTIANNGTVSDLYRNVDSIMNDFLNIQPIHKIPEVG